MAAAQLDPLSRLLFATMGRVLTALANGEIDLDLNPADSPFDAARRAIQDGSAHRDGRRTKPLRRNYSMKDDIRPSKLEKLSPAGRRIVKALTERPKQTLPDLIQITGLGKRTVENQLGTLGQLGILVRGDLLPNGDHG